MRLTHPACLLTHGLRSEFVRLKLLGGVWLTYYKPDCGVDKTFERGKGLQDVAVRPARVMKDWVVSSCVRTLASRRMRPKRWKCVPWYPVRPMRLMRQTHGTHTGIFLISDVRFTSATSYTSVALYTIHVSNLMYDTCYVVDYTHFHRIVFNAISITTHPSNVSLYTTLVSNLSRDTCYVIDDIHFHNIAVDVSLQTMHVYNLV
jgi:hypothetical protein